jgi:hypothetical protein
MLSPTVSNGRRIFCRRRTVSSPVSSNLTGLSVTVTFTGCGTQRACKELRAAGSESLPSSNVDIPSFVNPSKSKKIVHNSAWLAKSLFKFLSIKIVSVLWSNPSKSSSHRTRRRANGGRSLSVLCPLDRVANGSHQLTKVTDFIHH